MLKSIVLALSMLVVTPLVVQASEITLIPAVKLQIGDQDNHGNYWDGGHWRDHGWWGNHYEWRGNRWQPHGHGYDHHDRDRHDNDRHDDHWNHH